MRRPIRTFTIERKRPARIVMSNEAPLLDLAPPPPPPEPMPANRPAVPRWAAAEALFAPQPAPPAPSAKNGSAPVTGRILQSLVEPPATPIPDLEEDMPKRRGRKPGSRNKARVPLHTPDAQDAGAHGPRTIEKVMRNLFEFWVAEEDAPAVEGAEERAPAAAPSAQPLQLRRRSRIAREKLPRGERWKARLPKFAR